MFLLYTKKPILGSILSIPVGKKRNHTNLLTKLVPCYIVYIVHIQYNTEEGIGWTSISAIPAAFPSTNNWSHRSKNLILNGVLQDGEALPSMRLLAKELRISVITTKRAYEELEREGFLYTVVGKGSFVAVKNAELLREQQR